MAIGLFGLLLAIGAAGLGLRLYLERAAESRLRPGEDVAVVELPGPLPQNAFLACPPGHCALATAAPSPIFATDAERLYQAVLRLVASEPRSVIVLAEPRRRRIVAIQRSAVFGFPDIVIAQCIALGPGRASLALYSRARYGSADFGVNRRRVEAWLVRLRQLVALPSDQSRPPVPSRERPGQPGAGGYDG